MANIDFGKGVVQVDPATLSAGREAGTGIALPTNAASATTAPVTTTPQPFDRGPGNITPGSDPNGDLTGILSAVPTAPKDLNTLIEESRKQSQSQIDAISQGYDQQIEQEHQAGIVRDARTRALNIGNGLSGSDFASAAAEETAANTRKVIESKETEKSNAIAAVLNNADDRARAQQEKQTAQYRQDAQTALATRKAAADQAKEDIRTLGSQGITSEKLKTTDPALYSQLQKETGLTPLELDSYLLAAHPGIDMKNVKTTKIGDNLITSYVDPVTKQIVNSTYNVPGSEAYDGFTISQDGTALFYRKSDGTTKQSGTEGEFAKDPAPINIGKYGTAVYDADTKTWNKLTGAGAAASGTGSGSSTATNLYTKPTYSRLDAAGVDRTLADKLGAAILSGRSLEDIRQALKADGRDPQILDNFDRVVNIKSLIKNAPKSTASTDRNLPPA